MNSQLLIETHVFTPKGARLTENKSDRGLPLVEGILATAHVIPFQTYFHCGMSILIFVRKH